jgi:Flp pilus assembly protein TadD
MRRICLVIATIVVLVQLMLSCAALLKAQTRQSNSSAALAQGKAAMKRGDVATAESFLEQAVRENQSSAEPYFLLGVIYLKLGQTIKAESQLLRVVALRPNYPEAYNNLGILYDQQDQYDKSVPAFQASAPAQTY